ncbi:hypothetical protein [Streptomyces sp. NPDC059080]|uniref:hypothetical protein n=1 Tax=Streptomyces sp. NPDC059080 TaxID=3346718 RepID=UPI0036AD38F7
MSEDITFVWKKGPPLLPSERRRLLQLLFGDPEDGLRSPKNEPAPTRLQQRTEADSYPAVSNHPGDGTVSED